MKMVALYDIHGNLPALDAVLKEVEQEHPDLILVGGDIVPGPMPRSALERLLALGDTIHFIRGNCEREVVAAFDGLPPRPGMSEAVSECMRWTAKQLERSQRDFLAQLPDQAAFRVDGLGEVLFCHGSPRSDEDIVTAVSDPDRVVPMLAGVEEAMVVSGHTHVQFDRSVAGHRLVNAGSIGMPYQGVAGRAFWTLFGPGVEPRNSAFDAERFASILRSTGYPNPEWFEVETAENAAEDYEQMAREQAAGP
jgi:putative phosphoesterase